MNDKLDEASKTSTVFHQVNLRNVGPHVQNGSVQPVFGTVGLLLSLFLNNARGVIVQEIQIWTLADYMF